MKNHKISLSELKPGKVRHTNFTELFVKRVKRYKEILKEVETLTLEESLDSFSRDADPEIELFVWENIAIAYLLSVQGHQEYDFAEKKKVFLQILQSTM